MQTYSDLALHLEDFSMFEHLHRQHIQGRESYTTGVWLNWTSYPLGLQGLYIGVLY